MSKKLSLFLTIVLAISVLFLSFFNDGLLTLKAFSADMYDSFGGDYGTIVPVAEDAITPVSNFTISGDSGKIFFLRTSTGTTGTYYSVEIYSDSNYTNLIRNLSGSYSENPGTSPMGITWNVQQLNPGTYYGTCYTYIEQDGLNICDIDSIEYFTVNIVKESPVFSVETDGFSCNREITYTVKLKENVSILGAVLNFTYNPDIVSVVSAGSVHIKNKYGEIIPNVSGLYESGQKVSSDDTYVIAYFNPNEQIVTKETDFVNITFSLNDGVDSNDFETGFNIYCNEFTSSNELHCISKGQNILLSAFTENKVTHNVTVTEIAPTCTQEGSTVKHCDCLATDETIIVDALGHEFSDEWIIDEVATCIESGSKSRHCLRCDEKTDETVIPSTGHDFSEWQVRTEETCTTDGLKYRVCTNCSTEETEIISKTGHDFSDEWIIDEVATCIESGSKSRHCLRCDEKTDETVIPSTGHDFSEWQVRTEETCTTDGLKYRVCTNCSTEETEIISKTGHNYIVKNVLEVHPHTITNMCTLCFEEIIETPKVTGCLGCDFNITAIDVSNYKVVSYIGSDKNVVVPGIYNNCNVTTIAVGCFKGNDTIETVEIGRGITTIGSIAFMNCTALKKVYIPATVTSIGDNAFYGFTGTIYCHYNSEAYNYAVANGIDYVIIDIIGTENTTIDYENMIVFTSVYNCVDMSDIIISDDNVISYCIPSFVMGNLEIYGTGSELSLFRDSDYLGDYKIIVIGDLNGDGICNVLDAVEAERAVNEHIDVSDEQIYAANGCVSTEITTSSFQQVVNAALKN